MTETIIDFIRHGEPVGGRKIRGHGCDDPLSETGWRQMWQSIGAHRPWAHIVSSPLRRCHAFAQALAEESAVACSVDERFKEVGFGLWEGRTPAQIIDTDPDAYDAFYQDPVNHRPRGAEPLDAFNQRVAAGLRQTAETHAHQHSLVIAHAGVVRAAVGYVMQAPARHWYRLKIDYAGMTRIRFGRFGPTLEFHNAPAR